jgi:hypothetical protein
MPPVRESSRVQVLEVVNGSDVVCVARNDALLDGLLTVFHVERSSDELLNLQNDLPLLSDYDKECIISLAVVSRGGALISVLRQSTDEEMVHGLPDEKPPAQRCCGKRAHMSPCHFFICALHF